jgi:hypothetical protein
MINQVFNLRQEIYKKLLSDERLKCNCDKSITEEYFKSASCHYHQCALYQVTRAIKLTLKYGTKEGIQKIKKEYLKDKDSKNINPHKTRITTIIQHSYLRESYNWFKQELDNINNKVDYFSDEGIQLRKNVSEEMWFKKLISSLVI